MLYYLWIQVFHKIFWLFRFYHVIGIVFLERSDLCDKELDKSKLNLFKFSIDIYDVIIQVKWNILIFFSDYL